MIPSPFFLVFSARNCKRIFFGRFQFPVILPNKILPWFSFRSWKYELYSLFSLNLTDSYDPSGIPLEEKGVFSRLHATSLGFPFSPYNNKRFPST